MIVNIDQTGVSIVPVSDWTMAKEGSRQVAITGADDKRQITAVMGANSTGKLLPPQLIYAGKTDACHPKFKFPEDWHITHSDSHWSMSDTMRQSIQEIIVPYMDRVTDSLDLPIKQRGLCILDVFRAHRVDSVLELFAESDIKVVFVPASCTSELQPLDVSGNGPFKQVLKYRFTAWYADQVTDGLRASSDIPKVDLSLSTLKSLHASWVLHAFDKTARQTDLISLGWEKNGISAAIKAAADTQ